VLQPKVLDLDIVISNMEKMLKRLIGENIELRTPRNRSLGRIKADPGQVEQVIMNTVVNARDAMPRGGELTISTKNVVLDEAYVQAHPEVGPGPYVELTVSDTGVGMSDEVKARIFEPFFTTKQEGKGTGLGLATVQGIVKQGGGHIKVESELGAGTTFRIYLPQIEEQAEPPASTSRAAALPRGTETILLAEDDDTVRRLARRVLEGQGYTVLAASHPDEALSLCAQHSQPIDLLVTDVVMPGMGGRDLAASLAASRPGLRVLYVSGYMDDAIAHHGVLDPGIAFLPKPFTATTLAHRVRKVLDQSWTIIASDRGR
jgi:CheY-like chemotaxis protein